MSKNSKIDDDKTISDGQTAVRKQCAIMSVDASGYSRLMAQNEDDTQSRNHIFLSFLSDLVQKNHGIVHQIVGDNLIAFFKETKTAIDVSIDFQKSIYKKNKRLPGSIKLEYKIGIDYGVISLKNNLHYGHHINIASRLESFSVPGGIALSKNAVSQLDEHLEMIKYIGPISLKNINEPVEVFRFATGYEATNISNNPDSQNIEKPTLPKILVLPFKDINTTQDIPYLADGISENIIDALSKFRIFDTIPQINSVGYRETTLSLQEFKEFLSVDYLIEGSVHTNKDIIVIGVRVANTSTQKYIFTKKYSIAKNPPYKTIEKITFELVSSIEIKLNKDMLSIISYGKQPSNKTFRSFLKAKYEMDKWTFKSDKNAKGLLADIVKEAPSFAQAHALYAATLQTTDLLQPGYTEEKEDRILAKKHLDIAISLDDSDARIHANIAWNYMLSRQFIRAERHFNISAEINEYDTELMISRAIGKAYLGMHSDGIELAYQAIEYYPLHPDYYYGNLAAICVLAGRYDEAIGFIRTAPDVWPEIWAWHAVASVHSNEMAEAQKACSIFLHNIRESWCSQSKPTDEQIAKWLFRITALKQPSDIERFAYGICKAGLPISDNLINYYLHLAK